MTTRPYRHPVIDEQTWSEALFEEEMRSVVEVRPIAGGLSEVGLDQHGDVVYTACGRSQPDPVRTAQDIIETGSQVVGADDEWA